MSELFDDVQDWENVRTSETGNNRLLTTVWTTPFTGDVQECYEQEISFTREHMKRLGFDIDAIQQDVPDFTKEMQKIQGYPVIIDGKYYATKQGGEEDAGRVCQESFEEIKKTGQQ